MSLSKTLYPLLSTCLTKEDTSNIAEKCGDWDVKNQRNKQTKSLTFVSGAQWNCLTERAQVSTTYVLVEK